jgi:hypothetical protein
VGDDATTEFSVSATDLAPLESACSAPIPYTQKSDFTPPSSPQLTSTDPASPSASGTLRILGAAEAGSTVRVYAGPACIDLPIATGSAAELGSPGIPVQVAEGVTVVFSATATDASDNTSTCSAPISYTHAKATTTSGGGDGGPTPTLTCTVPKLVGKTPAQARAALTKAACKLGAVRKPRPRRGKRMPPLVVKSSTPAAGAKPAGGKVNLTLGPKPKRKNADHG